MTTQNEFAVLGLSAPLLRALDDKKYTQPSPIQAQAIPFLLAGRDVWGCAQTGTGKTAAFALPILQRLSAPGNSATRNPRALILTPTRELAGQISESFVAYGRYLPIRHTVVYGGVGLPRQVKILAHGVDVLVATPGRLLDLISQKAVSLAKIEVFVLDEADRMLDMGFAPDVKRIVAMLPRERQSLLFSATMPEAIRKLAEAMLKNPARIEIAPAATTVERVEQRVCHIAQSKKQLLLGHLLKETPKGLVLVFTRTKHGANNVAKKIEASGQRAGILHGNKSQNAREKALEDFRAGRARVLVATDIAARGIDVKGITLVINYDVPVEAEAYVHRIGRTARAGADGMALTLCCQAERPLLKDIQKLIRLEIPVHKHPFEGGDNEPAAPRQGHGQRQGRQGGQGGRRSSTPAQDGGGRRVSSEPRGHRGFAPAQRSGATAQRSPAPVQRSGTPQMGNQLRNPTYR